MGKRNRSGDDRRSRGGHDRGGDERGSDRGQGPGDSAFLDLEISGVLYGEASSIARQATRELIMDAIKERLFDRLGKELTELGHIAADELADDIEANLEIEALIEARRKSRAETKSLVARVFRDAPKGKKKKKGQ